MPKRQDFATAMVTKAAVMLRIGTIRKAQCRDARGVASGPLGAALDAVASVSRHSGEAEPKPIR
jgi:hypothetical protein